ncbi:MAG: dual-specificity RNA methyltransferase RlmN [Actinobacteria bacterium]|nr:dual-specificity RNA methyltransferase RlmN [Actinomycetota bacterium]NBY15639.1 dual-specificity RNA methyltransferase RlmN [Actinomycetota bacterium]
MLEPGELIMVAPKRQKPPTHWLDLSVAERKEKVVELGLPAFRADQISRQFFGRLSDDPMSWTDIPTELRGDVAAQLFPPLLTSVKTLDCDGGTTVKQVWKLFDGALVESVLMRYPERVTMCISSQAGCGMNCPFCATGQNGLTRNLSTAEIVEQIMVGARALANDEIAGGVGRVNNIVFMGMGEPMANYKNVISAIRRLTDDQPAGLGLSARGITVSTVGLVPRIYDLAKEGIPVTLAVSLHCPDDELRDTLVPINNRFKIAEVLEACWNYAEVTGRRVSIEYALIKDINDQAWRAELLGKLLQGHLVHVNLIPLNPTPGSIWTASRPEDERAFVRILQEHGVAATVRDTRGREIDGACGQLAASV